jgi:hypothetical protein
VPPHHDLWQSEVDEVARILTLEQGKPFHAEAVDDIAESGDYFQIAAEDVKRLIRRVDPHHRAPSADVHVRRPVGVWAAITPWNFPVMIPMEYVGPGLATGNAVIVKPPEFTRWALLEMAKVFEEAGVPPKGRRSRSSRAPATSARRSSPTTGRRGRLHRVVGDRPEDRLPMGLKRSIMEMSGNGPTIVTADADVAAAAEAAVYGAYYNAGQVCCATERVIVLDEVHDEFVEARSKPPRWSGSATPSTRTRRWARSTTPRPPTRWTGTSPTPVERGAEVLMGGRPGIRVPDRPLLRLHRARPGAGGLAGVPGGVVRARAADPHRRDDDDAVGMANRTHLGLQAAVFTNDLTKAFWYADRIRSGTVVVNDSTDFWETFQPFGGAAGTDTGWGRQRIDEFTDLQTVVFSSCSSPWRSSCSQTSHGRTPSPPPCCPVS